MKQMILLTTMIFSAMGSTIFSQESQSPPHWKFGYVTVYRIEDTASGFPPEVFPTVEKATFDKYATDGKIPSSVSAFLLEVPGLYKKTEILENRETRTLENGYVLFDAGMGMPNGNLVANLGKAMFGGYQPEKVMLVLITHAHADHIGGLLDGDARRFPNAKVLCSQPEYDHWSKQNNAVFERVKKAYGDDFRGGLVFDQGFALTNSETKFELIPIEDNKKINDMFQRGLVTITPLNAVGHTPGHTAFLIESSGEKMMIIGDLLHGAALQFPMPEVCTRYDMNQAEAVKSRRRILDMAVKENIPIGGVHFPSPGIGFVKKNAAGGYDFSPIKKTLFIDHRWNGNDSADYQKSILVNYVKNGKYLQDRPAAEALAWLEAELQTGNVTIIEVFDCEKRENKGSEGFNREIVRLSEKYQVPYSMQGNGDVFPGLPVKIHFPQKTKP